MDVSITAFTYIISLSAVINGLGIVHLLSGFSEFLRSKDRVEINHYWVFSLWAALQFLLHVLLWWSMWGVRGVGDINFLAYLYPIHPCPCDPTGCRLPAYVFDQGPRSNLNRYRAGLPHPDPT